MKYFKLLKIIFNKYFLIAIFISAIVSNSIVIILNEKYNNIYNNIEKADFIGTIVSSVEERQYYNRYKIKIDSVNKEKKYKNTYLFFNIKKELDIRL